MEHLHYHNNSLFLESVALTSIAKEFGTPTYVYSKKAIEESFLDYKNALKTSDHLICYSVKANSNLAVLNVLARLGAGFDIVSQGELERVLKAGGQANKIIFSGVGKQHQEMMRALEAGIYCFNVESKVELDRLQEVAKEANLLAPIALRINPDVDAKTHPYISTGLKENKFGIEMEQALSLYQYAQKLSHIRIKGVDCHIGSQLTELSPFLDAAKRLTRLLTELKEVGIAIEHVDVGGGLGVSYQDEIPPKKADYTAAIVKEFSQYPVKLVFEPGRSLIAGAGLFLTRIEYLKETSSRHFAIVDGAMNDLLRPSLYQAWHSIIPVYKNKGEKKTYDVVGPICESADYLGKNRQLSLNTQELLAVCDCGAYGFAMSSNYNSRPRAAEVMVDDGKAFLIRERESLSQVWAGEALLPR